MAYRVYLVDDDRFLVDLYAAKFKSAGHEPTVFSGGEPLLAQLRKDAGKDAPDAIVLDVIMPGMTGFETLQTIRKEKLVPNAKIIMLSNQGQGTDIEQGKELGADDYIVKASAIPSEVVAKVASVVAKTT